MGNLADMYRGGNCVGVWTDLVALGPDAIRDDLIDETREIALLTMAAVRRNLQALVGGLTDAGYVFDAAVGYPVLADGIPADALDSLEARVGVLPVALRAFAEQIGSVSVAGRHPDWNGNLADPLVVTFDPEFLVSEYEMFLADQGTEYESPEFKVNLAPDHLHKADISGGAPFSMVVPCRAADALLTGEGHNTTLVNYLRIALRWGGFPGWDPALGPRGTGLVGPWPDVLGDLAAEMEPF